MKQITILILAVFIFISCSKDEEPVVYQETGVVLNYAGAGHCSYVIELDNGQNILPLYYPDDFEFVNGQRVLLSYSELPNVVSTCGKGMVSEVHQIEEISCGLPLTEHDTDDFYNLPNDPVILNEIALVDDCLMLNVSFGGGCRNHTFELVKLEEEEQEDGIAVLAFRHDANGDACEAGLTMELSFDISSLREAGYTRFYFQALLDYDEIYIDLIDLE